MERKKHSKNQGFTLIELLVVIAVMGVLATIVLLIVNPQAQILKAQVSTTQATLKQMKTEIEGIRVLRNQTLLQITGSGCSECACRCVDARTDATCINSMTNAWSRISTKPLPRDPWGNILMYDENEGEGSPTNCTPDTLNSAGPDHIRACGSTDDISIQVPNITC